MYKVEFEYFKYGLFPQGRSVVKRMKKCISAPEFVRRHDPPLVLADDIDIHVTVFDNQGEAVSDCWVSDIKKIDREWQSLR